MSRYLELLQLARQQASAVQRGDLEAAIQALDARAELLADAPPPSSSDLEAIKETLVLDRQLSGAIRTQMLQLRDETLEMQRGRTALYGYGPQRRRRPVVLDRSA